MNLWELFLIAVGLSMDAFAVAMCRGLEMKKFNIKHAIIIALFFGAFQALMPFIGWAVGRQFYKYITDFDHWIAFVLLLFIGGKMLLDGIRKKSNNEVGEMCECEEKLNLKQLFIMAIATSIDALAIGVSFAFLGISIGKAVSLIGVTTFSLSLLGVFIGHKIGGKFEKAALIFGGIVLCLLGLKILLEHLGVISF